MKPRAVSARIDRKLARATFLRQPGMHKQREIRFAALPAGQAERALELLRRLEFITAELIPGRNALKVEYEIFEHTLETLEDALRDQGFHLSNSLYSKLTRALAYYCEETQLHNLESPQRLIKKSNEAYVQAWAQHQHGDHDDTPMELRHDK